MSARNDRSKDEPMMDEDDIVIEEAEFDKYACFYLDQFFLYLNASVSVQNQSAKSGWQA